MSFLKHFRRVVTGKIAKENQLVGNHGVRICEKIKKDDNPVVRAIVDTTVVCAVDLLTDLLFKTKDFTYNDGRKEPNPFAGNLNLLNRETSYDQLKFVAGYFFALFITEVFDAFKNKYSENADDAKLVNYVLELYEYREEDKIFFRELLDLVRKRKHNEDIGAYDLSKLHHSLKTEGKEEGVGRYAPEMKLYDHIFEKAYRIDPPQLGYQMMNFSIQCEIASHNIFPDGFWEVFSKYEQMSK